MIRRLYVHNFRCLENFELPIAGQSSILLIGNNGSGKTTVGLALEVLQKIARGTNRVGELVKPSDRSRGTNESPMRFEIDVELGATLYQYIVAFELPPGFKEMRVFEEKLVVGGKPIYTRKQAQVRLLKKSPEQDREAEFRIDWHLAALPLIQEQSESDPLFIFKRWLARVLILRPIPSLIKGSSEGLTLEPSPQASDFGPWWTGLLRRAPGAYTQIAEYLKQVMPDLKDITNPEVGPDTWNLSIQFSNHQGTMSLRFEDLADGEKCFMICALVLAANDVYGPLVCFWDEPDNYLALSEVGHFVMALRTAFESGGQFIATSHNPEAVSRFSGENTLVLQRRSHLEPTIVRPVSDVYMNGDLVGALARGDLET